MASFKSAWSDLSRVELNMKGTFESRLAFGKLQCIAISYNVSYEDIGWHAIPLICVCLEAAPTNLHDEDVEELLTGWI